MKLSLWFSIPSNLQYNYYFNNFKKFKIKFWKIIFETITLLVGELTTHCLTVVWGILFGRLLAGLIMKWVGKFWYLSNTAQIKMQAADLKHRSLVTGQVRSYGHCHDLFNLYLSLFHWFPAVALPWPVAWNVAWTVRGLWFRPVTPAPYCNAMERYPLTHYDIAKRKLIHTYVTSVAIFINLFLFPRSFFSFTYFRFLFAIL